MAQRIPLFQGSNGLNTNVDYVRLGRGEPSAMALSEAYNVVVQDAGRVARRQGMTEVVSLAAWSVWAHPDGEQAVLAADDGLYLVTKEGELTDLGVPLSTPKNVKFLRWVWSGPDGVHDDLFWCNGHEKGRLDLRLMAPYSWANPAGDVVSDDGAFYSGSVPVGYDLALWDDRIWVAQLVGDDHILWYTERYNPLSLRLSGRFLQVEGRVTLLAPVDDGLWVGTGGKIWFYGGQGAEGLSRNLVASYPAIPGTVAPLSASEIGDGSLVGEGYVVSTTEGLCFLGLQGNFINLTRKRIEYPSAQEGCACVQGGDYSVWMR